jgi:choline-glycine betaine transporter
MNKSNNTFRDKLLDMEIPTPALKEKYEREVQAMVEKKLTGLRKLGTVVSLVMGLGFFVLFGTLAVIVPKEFPLWGRAIWAVGSVFGLTFAGLAVLVLKKGTVNLKTDDMAMAGLGWGFIVIMATITLVFSGQLPDRTIAIKMLVSLLIFEVAAAVGLLKAIIERSEVKTREKLLKIEYHLAEISEKIDKKPENVKE